ncbi:unnamed protein product, partial [Iphiclides podalirius]
MMGKYKIANSAIKPTETIAYALFLVMFPKYFNFRTVLRLGSFPAGEGRGGGGGGPERGPEGEEGQGQPLGGPSRRDDYVTKATAPPMRARATLYVFAT